MLEGQSSVGMEAGGVFEDVLSVRWRAQVPRRLLESCSRRPGLSAKVRTELQMDVVLRCHIGPGSPLFGTFCAGERFDSRCACLLTRVRERSVTVREWAFAFGRLR